MAGPVLLLALLLALLAPPTHAAPSACPVPETTAETRERGSREIGHYEGWRRIEFAPDLMGYRRGPRLGPASRGERREIAEARSTRREFALNASTLLIRRLMRDRRAVERGDDWLFIPMTANEAKQIRFRDKFETEVDVVSSYVERCASEDYAGLWIYDRPRRGVYLGIRYTRDLRLRKSEIEARFRYPTRIRVLPARFTFVELERVHDRIDADLDYLEERGLRVSEFGVDESRNRVEVRLSNPSERAQRILDERYGPAVWMHPRPTRIVAA